MVTKKSPAKSSTLETAIEGINKRFGNGIIARMGDTDITPISSISSGIPDLDRALGVGGWPKGRVVEIKGPESSGKSTVALHLVAEAQRLGLTCAYMDMEYALDPAYMTALGVDVDNLLLSQPDTAEQVLSIVEELAKSGAIAVVVVDSVNSLVTQAQRDGEIGEAYIGNLARLMSQGLAKIVGAASRSGTIVVFINQLRANVGVIYGPKTTTTGGNALKFYASVQAEVKRGDKITIKTDDGEEVIGNKTEVKLVKNKVGAAYRTAKFDIIYGKGAPKSNSLYDLAIQVGALRQSGAWVYTADGEQFANGATKAKDRLANEPWTYSEVESRVAEVLQENKNAAE